MFRLRLHPTSSGLLSGIAVIGFWALLWLVVFAQLVHPGAAGPERAPALSVAQVAARTDGANAARTVVAEWEP
jgi:hypothetical protein